MSNEPIAFPRSDAPPPPPKAKKKKKTGEIAISLAHVSKHFGAKIAVQDLSLKIESGLIFGLIGPNGAGKTTTFSMLAGYLQPTRGEIGILGFAPQRVDELRSRIGVLPQDALLPASDKVGEFLVHMARLQNMPREKAISAAQAGLLEVEGRDWWNVRCGSLSHGMAKRVALAQALLGAPEVVLLDEPTAGLDPRVAYEVRQLIKTRRGRCTVIVSSHNLQELEEVCDAAAILDRGHLVAEGTIAELTTSAHEIHIKLAPSADASGIVAPPPLDAIRALGMVGRVEWNDQDRELIVHFDREKADAETTIGATLWVLLQSNARISAVTKGRGLEQRVMELTD